MNTSIPAFTLCVFSKRRLQITKYMYAFKSTLWYIPFLLAASPSINVTERKRVSEQSCRLAHLLVFLSVRPSVGRPVGG